MVRIARYALSVACALLGGCGGSQLPVGARGAMPGMQVARQSSGSTYKVTKGLIFVTLPDPYIKYEDVQVYDVRQKNPAPLAYIRDGLNEPQGDCMDSKGTLYVANVGGGSWISEYAIGSTTPSTVITRGLSGPTWCAIDRHDNLWVSNTSGVNVTEYLRGSSVPHEVITDGLTNPVGIATDHADNLYVANNGGNGANVQVYHSGHSSPSRTITDGVSVPVGIGIDSAGTLYVTNITPGNIEEYHSGSSKPFHKITQGMNGPIGMTFSPSGWMYVTNFGVESGGSGPPDAILEFPPHQQLPGKRTITQGLYAPGSTAFYPPAVP